MILQEQQLKKLTFTITKVRSGSNQKVLHMILMMLQEQQETIHDNRCLESNKEALYDPNDIAIKETNIHDSRVEILNQIKRSCLFPMMSPEQQSKKQHSRYKETCKSKRCSL